MARILVKAYAHSPTNELESYILLSLGELPHTTLIPGEHPVEAAWRLLKDATPEFPGGCFTAFRRTGGKDDELIFETSCDAWPPPRLIHNFTWEKNPSEL